MEFINASATQPLVSKYATRIPDQIWNNHKHDIQVLRGIGATHAYILHYLRARQLQKKLKKWPRMQTREEEWPRTQNYGEGMLFSLTGPASDQFQYQSIVLEQGDRELSPQVAENEKVTFPGPDVADHEISHIIEMDLTCLKCGVLFSSGLSLETCLHCRWEQSIAPVQSSKLSAADLLALETGVKSAKIGLFCSPSVTSSRSSDYRRFKLTGRPPSGGNVDVRAIAEHDSYDLMSLVSSLDTLSIRG